jgi:hypothetical protein
LLSSTAAAQDFGSSWIDRVTHQLIEEDGPLNPHPVELKASVGELYTYDSNIFLTNTGRTSDSVFTTFANGSLKYAQPEFDAEADLTVNYNLYLKATGANADEERFFGRFRYQGSQITLGLAEILRRESSPTDVTFASRVSRLLSNTTPLVALKINEIVAVEVQSDLQLVRYANPIYALADNFNSRSVLTAAYTTGWNDLDALLQFGTLTINYDTPGAPPNVKGYYARIGVRGEICPNLHVLALAGFTRGSSMVAAVSLNTADVEIHVAYTVSELVTLYVDYSRRIGFSTGGSPFEVVDSADVIVRYSVRDDLALKGRIQYDVANPIVGPNRAYGSASAGAEYRLLEHLRIEAGVAYRWGSIQQGTAGNFSDVLGSVGIAGVF